MTRDMMHLGFLATALILVILTVAIMREPSRQLEAAEEFKVISVREGADLYAENCVACHGASGEGLGAYPALANQGIQTMDAEVLTKIIERGRYSTAMAAFGVDEGGLFTNAQIDSLVTLLLYGNWQYVDARVAELGLTPPEITAMEVSEETLLAVRDLPDGTTLADGMTLYAENCAACHGANGEGTGLAPALNSDELRGRLSGDDITRIVQQGVPGTLMASWNAALSPDQVASITTFLRRWDEIVGTGAVMPVVETAEIDLSPEAVATGQRLYNILCKSCHGFDAYGTPLAPALNNQLFLSETPDAAIQQIISLGVSGTVMPAWGGRLTEADIAALTAYLRSLEPTAPVIVEPASTNQ